MILIKCLFLLSCGSETWRKVSNTKALMTKRKRIFTLFKKIIFVTLDGKLTQVACSWWIFSQPLCSASKFIFRAQNPEVLRKTLLLPHMVCQIAEQICRKVTHSDWTTTSAGLFPLISCTISTAPGHFTEETLYYRPLYMYRTLHSGFRHCYLLLKTVREL